MLLLKLGQEATHMQLGQQPKHEIEKAWTHTPSPLKLKGIKKNSH